jgi:hypothetical protein
VRYGYGLWRTGRWWFYADSARGLSVGRIPDECSVIYSLFGLVAEHYRPEDYAEQAEILARGRLIRRWQAVRNAAWARSEWCVEQHPDETYEEWARRRWHYTCVRYEASAADARARRDPAPDIDELRIHAPVGIPAAAYPRT